MKRIAFLTDLHLDEDIPVENLVDQKENLKTVLADLFKRNIHEIIFGGDIGSYTAYPLFFETLRPFDFKIIIGNHDNSDKVFEFYQPELNHPDLNYHFEDENFKYLFLDSSKDLISESQIHWLKLQLKTNKQILLFIHHPVLDMNTIMDKLYPLKNRKILQSILEESGLSITIFCGHYHMNDERRYNNIRQITTQSLVYQIKKEAPQLQMDGSVFGYRIIELNVNKIETQIISFKQ